MRTQRLVAGVATVGLLGVLSPVAAAAPEPDAPTNHDDTTEVGPSVEDHLARTLDGPAGQEVKDLRDRAEASQRQQGMRAGAEDTPRPKGRGGPEQLPESDLPDANPGPEPEKDATAHELVGTTREWLGLDATGQTPGNFAGYYPKEYRLAAVGEHIELWVAVGGNAGYDPDSDTYTLPFATEGDCRNTIAYDGQTRTEITPEQLNQLVADFDQNMYPLETEAFATPPTRNGQAALYNAPGFFGDVFGEKPAGYFATPDGGDRTVTLIDNVRDDAYYTPPDEEQLSYIAGFFSPVFNAVFDRNVMTVDAYDWLHRTGEDPPDHGSEDPCEGAAARPFLYEGTFAHEWQHLLQSYVGGESTWVNEGLSDWAQTLTGYVDPSRQIDEAGYDSHVQCFTGFLAEQTAHNQQPREDSGPENSLTWWEDQGPGEILCDYGAAYTFMEYTAGQFGTAAMSQLFADPAAGLDSVSNVLAAFGDGRDSQDYLHDWAAMVALDGALDRNGGRLDGGDAYRYATPTLASAVNWDENDAYDTPGAPPNGSDYVRVRDAGGGWVSGSQLRSITFAGSDITNVDPTPWTSVDEDGDAVLYSGMGDGLDNTMAFATTVPTDDPTLRFDTKFSIEYGWDYGFVQLSTDGGESWTSLANEITNEDNQVGSPANPGYFEQIAAELPGIGGNSVAEGEVDPDSQEGPNWIPTEFDLSEHAGEDVLIGFRYMTDGAFQLPGWWVDDVRVGDELVTDGSSVANLSSYEQLAPPSVAGWHVTLVGYRSKGGAPAAILSRDVAPGESVSFDRRDLRDFRRHDVVGAIVTQDEPTEQQLEYAPYELTVNGVLQPGGG